jgi:pimeloyl-ACP methyl ester carboxylesterase
MRSLVVLALFVSACSSEPSRAPAPPAAERAEPPAPEAPPAPSPTPEPPPLPEAREVRIEAQDGAVLVGDLREGASPEAPLVILIHQLGSTRAEWMPLLRGLAASPGMTTFALDMRGHGASTTGSRGHDLAYASFTNTDWRRIAGDVRAVLAHLREQEGLRPRSVALVGSSIGSSAAILAAAEEPSVDAIVALSPGRANHGLDTITPLPSLAERPILALASRGDLPSAEAANDIARIARGGEVLLVDGDRHGVAIFEGAPESLERVRSFLRDHLED